MASLHPTLQPLDWLTLGCPKGCERSHTATEVGASDQALWGKKPALGSPAVQSHKGAGACGLGRCVLTAPPRTCTRSHEGVCSKGTPASAEWVAQTPQDRQCPHTSVPRRARLGQPSPCPALAFLLSSDPAPGHLITCTVGCSEPILWGCSSPVPRAFGGGWSHQEVIAISGSTGLTASGLRHEHGQGRQTPPCP